LVKLVDPESIDVDCNREQKAAGVAGLQPDADRNEDIT
jgi:hypothetical protein